MNAAAFAGMRRGIEKESLRASAAGQLARTPHPPALGSPLTHPHITTDFCESQLELITAAHTSVDATLEELAHIHQVVYRTLGEEILWGASMPCGLPPDAEIPLARYGVSNVGRAKTVYRMGLAHRYGPRMQTISGIHYNWSLPERSSDEYFALVRNFRRTAWLLFYLFGASPAVCESFVAGNPRHGLQPLAPGTLYLPHATSLRMGRLGYQSDAQSKLAVSYNNLDDYGASLYDALTTPYAAYEKIGLRDERGEYRQLSTSLLQIENEFYGKIRPKRRIEPGERPLHALRARGVEYVEVRLMDLDPFSPVGITAQTCRFLDVFLLRCLQAESPPDSPAEIATINRNQERVAARGREPGLALGRGEREVPMREWGAELLAECKPIAEALDAALGGAAYRDAVQAAQAALEEPDSTPSARVLHAMQRNHGGSYLRFVLAESLAHRGSLLGMPLPPAVEDSFAELARASLEKQRETEASDRIDFETWRRRYLDPQKLKA
ncbi:MAG TPA: glutamate--cysteine ligase [Burkholderiales bacterium]|nr:glutamate--cysteine ligase [Burkholderiales bacterium]